MAATRWKLMAGVFGISVCGLAVLAEPSCRTVGHVAHRQSPAEDYEVGKRPVVAPAPISVQPPVITVQSQVPSVPAVVPLLPSAPLPASTSSASPVIVSTPAESPPVTPPVPVISPEPPLAPKVAESPLPLPTPMPVPTPVPVPVVLRPEPEVKPLPLPVPAVKNPEIPPAPVPVVATTPVPLVTPTTPTPAYTGPVLSADKFVEEMKKLPEVKNITGPIVDPAIAKDAIATPKQVATKVPSKLRVIMQLTDTNPQFEIRDGEELLLKVVADQMEIKSGKEKGEVWSLLNATGNVRFTTPGGNGTCQSLILNHATGEIRASGAKFTHHWGKVETTVVSESMSLQLGVPRWNYGGQ